MILNSPDFYIPSDVVKNGLVKRDLYAGINEEKTPIKICPTEKQIQKSRENLDQIKEVTEKYMKKFKQKNEISEQQRRKERKNFLKTIFNRVELEQKQSKRNSASIEMRWKRIERLSSTFSVCKEINEQKERISQILVNRSTLINNLQEKLKKKDFFYLKMLKEQGEEINQLCGFIDDKILKFNEKSKTEIQKIEDKFQRERELVLSKREDELDNKIKSRQQLEIEFSKERLNKIKEYEQNLDTTHNVCHDSIKKLENDLDLKMCFLEQKLQTMKSVFILNSEKLKYYCDILEKELIENNANNKGNKIILQKLQDQLLRVKTKYSIDDKKLKQINKKKTNICKRLTKQYKDILTNFRRFETTDQRKFKLLWKLNEESCQKLTTKLITSNKFIHSSVLNVKLNLDYKFPNINKIENEQKKVSRNKKKKKVKIKEEDSDVMFKKLVLSKVFNVLRFLFPNKLVVNKLRIKNIDNNREIIDFFTIDSLLKKFGIETKENIDEFVSWFIKGLDENLKIDDKTEMKEILDKYIRPETIVRTINEFLKHKKEHGLKGDEEKKRKKRTKKREKSSFAYKNSSTKKFWNGFLYLTKGDVELWNQIEKKLDEYYKDLKKRGKLVKENLFLTNQNVELKTLLKMYDKRRFNELYLPETAEPFVD